MLKRTLRNYPILCLFLFYIASVNPAFALEPVFSNFLGQAIRGYDAVAYFKEAKPVEGKSTFQTEWMGTSWRFASQANLDLFKANPDSYAPQFGGYCAYAVSNGYTASTDPEAWTIHDGKLYLNYSKGVRDQWSQNIPTNIQKAEANWPGLLAGD